MYKFPLFIITLATMLTACDSGEHESMRVTELVSDEKSTKLAKKSAAKDVEKFNLTITDEILHSVLPMGENKYSDSEKQLIQVKRPGKHESVKVSGNVFLEDFEPGNVPSIDGARIDFKIPFGG